MKIITEKTNFKEKNLKKLQIYPNIQDEITELVGYYDGGFDLVGNKAVAIGFSGGYDSTSLIIRRLEEGYDVYPFEISFIPGETLIRVLIIKILREKYGERLHRLIPLMNVDRGLFDCEFESGGYNQQPMCAFFAAFLPAEVREKVEKVELAYVVGDGAISFLDNLEAIYENTFEFKRQPGYNSTNSKPPKLCFPYKKIFHEDNVDYINSYEEILPCCAGDGTAQYQYGKVVDKKKTVYYIEITDANKNTDHLNKRGHDYSDYVITIESELTYQS